MNKADKITNWGVGVSFTVLILGATVDSPTFLMVAVSMLSVFLLIGILEPFRK